MQAMQAVHAAPTWLETLRAATLPRFEHIWAAFDDVAEAKFVDLVCTVYGARNKNKIYIYITVYQAHVLVILLQENMLQRLMESAGHGTPLALFEWGYLAEARS